VVNLVDALQLTYAILRLEKEVKKDLRAGDAATLNVWSAKYVLDAA
jgi:hypothetical protein